MRDGTNFRLSDNSFDGGDDVNYPQPGSHQVDILEVSCLGKFFSNNQIHFRASLEPEHPYTP